MHYTQPRKKGTTKIFHIICLDFFLGQNCLCIIDCWQENCLKKYKITLVWPLPMCKHHGLSHRGVSKTESFPALLIENQFVIRKLEESRPESRKIETVTSLRIAWRNLFSGCTCMLWIIHFQPRVIFFWI